MARREHVEIVRSRHFNEWREKHPQTRLDLRGADLSGAHLYAADLVRANLRGACLNNAHLRNANLSGADLTGAFLYEADLRQAVLQEATLEDTSFDDADLRGANLYWARAGQSTFDRANLSGAQLIYAHFILSSFDKADLSRADLANAQFNWAELTGTNFSGANLKSAWLESADLTLADFTDANLTWSHLERARFHGSCVNGADLRGARFAYTSLADIDLSSARNLEATVHEGPSHISTETFLRSDGRIADEFLRMAGVHPRIQLLLTNRPEGTSDERDGAENLRPGPSLRLDRCFVSYWDQAEPVPGRLLEPYRKPFSEDLHNALNTRGRDFWYRPWNMSSWGTYRSDELDEQIAAADRVVMVVSKESLEDDRLLYEAGKLFEKESRTGKQVLFPVMADDTLYRWEHPLAQRLRSIATDFRGAREGAALERALDQLWDRMYRD